VSKLAVLEQLPKRFEPYQIRTVRGLKNKWSSEIFAAIIHWIEAGTVKRKDRGLYALEIDRKRFRLCELRE
jgi:hypothetical protein